MEDEIARLQGQAFAHGLALHAILKFLAPTPEMQAALSTDMLDAIEGYFNDMPITETGDVYRHAILQEAEALFARIKPAQPDEGELPRRH